MRLLACLFCALPGLSAVAAAATPTASSVGTTNDGVKHTASRAFDGDLTTAWAEGVIGDGEGSWLEVRFDRPVDIGSVSIWPGWMGGVDRDLRLHGRPRGITVTFDVIGGQDVVENDVIVDPGEQQRPLRHDLRVDAKKVAKVRIQIDDVYSGGIYSDTYITEVAFNLVAGEPVAQVEQVASWLDTRSGQAAEEAHRNKVIALYEKISTEDFGDRDSLRQLMDWAANGAPHVRARVASRVPWGFRLNAQVPDKHAIEALLKIKDANAATALDRAALRTTGKLSDQLAGRARLLSAYAEISGGGRRNIAAWGETGFEKGALKSFGEPLALAVDEYGGLYVADVANHRVQRFSLDNGAHEADWGNAQPGLTDFWFSKHREPYGTGSEPGGESGFILPVDVEIVSSGKGDTVYVLDYANKPDQSGPYGRLTVIGPDGNISHRQELPFSQPISPRAGGEAHLVVDKKKATVLWTNEGVTYDVKSWEPGEVFSLEDGSPRGAIALKGGRMGLIYGDELVMYGPDGFRFGTVMGPDTLGPGYEDWDIAYDERNKLWVVLDTGDVVKLKKPGKVDFRFQLSATSFEVPRIDVYDDLVFVSSKDHIVTGDALRLHAEQSTDADQGGQLDLGAEE